MTRMEFLKQLEYLLQDIDEKDREDALAYYMDCLLYTSQNRQLLKQVL